MEHNTRILNAGAEGASVNFSKRCMHLQHGTAMRPAPVSQQIVSHKVDQSSPRPSDSQQHGYMPAIPTAVVASIWHDDMMYVIHCMPDHCLQSDVHACDALEIGRMNA